MQLYLGFSLYLSVCCRLKLAKWLEGYIHHHRIAHVTTSTQPTNERKKKNKTRIHIWALFFIYFDMYMHLRWQWRFRLSTSFQRQRNASYNSYSEHTAHYVSVALCINEKQKQIQRRREEEKNDMWSSFRWDVCTYSSSHTLALSHSSTLSRFRKTEQMNGRTQKDHKLKMNSLCDMFMHMEKQTKQKR